MHRHESNPNESAIKWLKGSCSIPGPKRYSCNFVGIPEGRPSKEITIEEKINSLLVDLFCEEWMDEADWIKTLQNFNAQPGCSVENLKKDFLTGVANGYTIDQQISICRKLLKPRFSLKQNDSI